MAYDITTCRVTNKHDDILMTICTEWLESSIKMTILSAQSSLLVGEMKFDEVDTFAKNLSKTRSEYLDTTRLILSGKDTSVEFILKDTKLRWKKGAWNYGMMKMVEASLVKVFGELLEKLLLRHGETEISVERLNRENEDLRNTQTSLIDKLEQIIEAKNVMEDDLYRRFVVILNLKKEKIRQLKNELRKRNAAEQTQSVFDIDTDDDKVSEEEEGGDKKKAKEIKKKLRKVDETRNKIEARQSKSLNFESAVKNSNELILTNWIGDPDAKMIYTDYEEDEKTGKNHAKSSNKTRLVNNSKESVWNKPSTSKDLPNLNACKNQVDNNLKKSCSASPNASSMFNFTSEESEEDLFS